MREHPASALKIAARHVWDFYFPPRWMWSPDTGIIAVSGQAIMWIIAAIGFAGLGDRNRGRRLALYICGRRVASADAALRLSRSGRSLSLPDQRAAGFPRRGHDFAHLSGPVVGNGLGRTLSVQAPFLSRARGETQTSSRRRPPGGGAGTSNGGRVGQRAFNQASAVESAIFLCCRANYERSPFALLAERSFDPASMPKPAASLLPRKQLLEICDRLRQAFPQRRLRLPTQNGLCLEDIWLALPRVVRRQRPKPDLRFRAGHCDDEFGKLQNRRTRLGCRY